MDAHVCMICNDTGHPSRKCPELYGPLYGKLGEGAQKGQHGEEDAAHIEFSRSKKNNWNNRPFSFVFPKYSVAACM